MAPATAGAAVCGDGIVDAGEECDEGNGMPLDAPNCDSDCTLPECGDGHTNPTFMGEECDEGGAVDSANCDSDCTLPECGDGHVNSVIEDCESGGVDTQVCDGAGDCTAAECGDGYANAANNEDCDTGGNSDSCDSDCTFSNCGDGFTNGAAGETCDDGNDTNTDSCTNACVSGDCGDGFIQSGEACDAGGEDTDSCDFNCTSAECGDGYVNSAALEICDDGNAIDNDGCNSNCVPGACVVGPSCPGGEDFDGDGIANATDNCPTVNNDTQDDSDEDGVGDECDTDANGDGIPDNFAVGGGGCSVGGGGALGVLFVALCIGFALRRRRARIASLIIAAGISVPLSAGAQLADDFSVERFRLASDRAGILDVEWGQVPEAGTWEVGVWVGASNDPLVVSAMGSRVGSLVGSRFGGDLIASMAFMDRFEVALSLPLVISQEADLDGLGTMAELAGGGVGDPRVAGKVELYDKSDTALALVAAVTVPIGSSDGYIGESNVTVAPELVLSRRFGAIRIASNLGYRLRENQNIGNLEAGDEILLRFGWAYGLAENGGPPVEIDVTTSAAVAASGPLSSANQTHVELLGGVTAGGGQVVGFSALGVGLNEGYGTPDWRAIAGVRVGFEPSR